MTLTELIRVLVETPSVDGYEADAAIQIADIAMKEAGGFFDRREILQNGSVLLKHSGKTASAPVFMMDAHIDTVGFTVSEICGRGFVKAVPLGGIDPYVLPSTPVLLHGKKDVYGVFSSVPPHLLKGADKDKAIKVSDLYIDTGLSDEELQETVRIGTPVTYFASVEEMANGIIMSKYLDDKACVAAIIRAARLLADEGYDGDTEVVAHFCVGEEKTAFGAKTIPYIVDADACIVLDVNFAHTPGVNAYESLERGKGGGVSYSSTIRRELTEYLEETAKKHSIPLQRVVEMRSTGTNATQIMKNGIPCAVLSVPLGSMHTDTENLSLSDVGNTAKVLAAAVRDFPTYMEKAGGKRYVV